MSIPAKTYHQFLKLDAWQKLMNKWRIDPYLIWSDLTEFRQFETQGTVIKQLSFLVEFHKPYDPKTSDLNVPDVYEQPLNRIHRSHFVTARLEVPENDPPALDKLIARSDIWGVQLGFPVSAQLKEKTSSQAPELPPLPADEVICGVLDDGCAFAHDQFRVPDKTATRVWALWDQTPIEDPSFYKEVGWSPPYRFAYGLEITKSSLDKIIDANDLGSEVDEDLCYEQVFRRRQHGLDICHSHGTAVMDLMTGRVDRRSYPHEAKPSHSGEAPIVFVQFPSVEVSVSNGRWLSVNALDGLRYLLDVAARIEEKPKPADGMKAKPRKVVANLSYGALAGPHDGSGMLTRAIDELCKIRGNFGVVLASGNSRIARGHCEQTIKIGDTGALYLSIPPDKSYETYVEVWFGDDAAAKKADIMIKPPRGSSKTIKLGEIVGWDENEVRYAANLAKPRLAAVAIFAPRVVQGKQGTMLLLAAAGTQLTGRHVSAPSGEWQISVKNNHSLPITINAWIERDDVRLHGRNQFAHFEEAGVDTPTCVTTSNTLVSIGGGEYPFTVGGYVDVDPGKGKLGFIAKYSGQGGGDAVPPVYARTEMGFTLSGVRTAGTRSGSFTRMTGTSAAAPQLGRALMDEMYLRKGPLTGDDIKLLLTTLVKNYCFLRTPNQLALPEYHDDKD